MYFSPKDLYERLEFDKILHLLHDHCLGTLAQEAILQLEVSTDILLIRQQLEEVSDYKRGLEQNDRFPLQRYEDIRPDLKMLAIEGYVLSADAFHRLWMVLRSVSDIYTYFNKDRKEVYPALYAIMAPLAFEPAWLKAIEKVIDQEGNIRPDASPELQSIRRQINAKQNELDNEFRRLIQVYRGKGWLSDNVESLRNGRRVLSVPSEHKRKIKGIVHDESATGKTAFLEPEPIIEINNDIIDLEAEEQREIFRILRALSAALHPSALDMGIFLEVMVRLDIIQTKAQLAVMLRANMPRMTDAPKLGIQTGLHPLLLLKNKQIGRKTVSFDLTLHGANRILLLSGPNAGGKSVTMKATGLLQLMLQAGMLIPVQPLSEMGIFHKIFADIGDQQSLEDDLSTYSSRLRNMKELLDEADGHSLVLIDEFGSGTDPVIGGAIAEAILRDLNFKGAFGIITTHYSNLKIFAFKNKGIVNGSMLFDREHLSPTYELRVGRPGSSYAFEIAHKVGLEDKVLQYARKRAGKNEKAVDELLIDLQREKQEVEEKLAGLSEKEKQLEKLIKNYDQLSRDLEFRRKKFKLEVKEAALQKSARENQVLEGLIRELREAQNIEKAKELATQIREERNRLHQEVGQLQEKVAEVQPVPSGKLKSGAFAPGDFVRLRSGGSVGQIESIDKKKAIVLMGQMRLSIKLADLEHAHEPMDPGKTRGVMADTVEASAQFESKIDIRGMRMDEALIIVQNFVDQALMNGSDKLRILHGKGDGILRKAVKNKLREYGPAVSVSHPPAASGGDGVTLVELS